VEAAEFTDDIRDGMQEIANVAVGQSAEKVAENCSAFIHMPIPRVHLIESADIMMALTTFEESARVTAVTQAFIGAGVSGEAMLLFSDGSLGELAALMGHGGQVLSDAHQRELVLEIASLLIATCVQGISQQLSLDVMIKHPALYGQHTLLGEMLRAQRFPWKRTLAVELNYRFEGFDLSCDLVVLFHERCLAVLFDKIGLLLD
jgi:chemotaxis protein CheY-P-specific phosphatase CheC